MFYAKGRKEKGFLSRRRREGRRIFRIAGYFISTRSITEEARSHTELIIFWGANISVQWNTFPRPCLRRGPHTGTLHPRPLSPISAPRGRQRQGKRKERGNSRLISGSPAGQSAYQLIDTSAHQFLYPPSSPSMTTVQPALSAMKRITSSRSLPCASARDSRSLSSALVSIIFLASALSRL